MSRTLTAAALAALSLLSVTSAFAVTDPAAAPKSAKARKVAPKAVEPESVGTTKDDLNPGQLSMADRVLTGVADCEFKQKVAVEKIDGHSGNFKLTFDRKSYIMVPEETTTGAIRLVDSGGTFVWVQIPKKSMLLNQKVHQRVVDDCQADEQRIATQSASQAGANAPFLAPSVATPASAAAAAAVVAAVGGGTAPATPATPATPETTTTTTTVTTTTVKVVPPPPVKRVSAAPAAAASSMWK